MTPTVRELTAPTRGAVSVLEVEGEGAAEAVSRLIPGDLPAPGSFGLVRLRLGEELLDEALCVRREPARIELHVHGSPPLVARLRELLAPRGPARALPAALPLEEAAQRELAAAPSEAAARVLLDQAGGALRRALEALDPRDASCRERARELLRLGERLAPLLRPPLVVLAGPVNAGKSTLFNLLVGHQRVLVADTPGTTRDAILERAHLGGWAVDLVDTAGERSGEDLAEDPLERAGQAVGRDLRATAALVLWLAPRGEGELPSALAGGAGPRSVRIVSHADRLPASARVAGPAISALEDPVGTRRTVAEVLRSALDLPDEPWSPGRAVPFLASQLEALERLAEAASPEVRAGLLERLLAR